MGTAKDQRKQTKLKISPLMVSALMGLSMVAKRDCVENKKKSNEKKVICFRFLILVINIYFKFIIF
ncbi:MAG: hypothetical protein HF967_02215 [Methanosarcinales archaeon]|nr:hypothetical protein [Methanosarcinales archaeon]